MRVDRAIQNYGDVKVTTGVASADNIQLIQMLFDGLLESLSVARGHILHRNIGEKCKAVARASRIVLGLQRALDFENGGELANHLNELYSYVIRRLFQANARNDLEILDEVYGLMKEIRDAWQEVPSLIPPGNPSGGSVN